MRTSIARFMLIALSITGLVRAPIQAPAQATDRTSAEKKPNTAKADMTQAKKPAKGGPFHGKLAAVDKVAKTITVGKRTFQITSKTKIKKGGRPATLEEAVVGETVSGYVKPGKDGKLVATTVNIGPKPAPQESEKPKARSEQQKQPKAAQPQ